MISLNLFSGAISAATGKSAHVISKSRLSMTAMAKSDVASSTAARDESLKVDTRKREHPMMTEEGFCRSTRPRIFRLTRTGISFRNNYGLSMLFVLRGSIWITSSQWCHPALILDLWCAIWIEICCFNCQIFTINV
jgi:hypothetical protein